MKCLKLFAPLLALLATFAFGATTTTLTLSWTAPSQNTDGSTINGPITYTVYEYANGSYIKVTTGLAATSYLVPNLTPNTSYTFHVTATVGGNESGTSQNASGTTLPLPPVLPNPPTNVTVK